MLFRVLCSGVSVFMFGLCLNLQKLVSLLVILVAVVVVSPVCV